LLAAVLGVALAFAACGGGTKPAYPFDKRLRLNQVQVLATHNSYHVRSSVQLPQAIKDTLDYNHPALDVQMDKEGVRSFEIDVVNAGNEFKVEHIPVVDAVSNCSPLTKCLRVLKKWSGAHPNHVPLFVLVEPKDGMLERGLDPSLGSFDELALDRLDRDVRSVLKRRDVLTPDDVRRKSPTLRDAVVRRGWPTLAKTRGKIVLILNDDGVIRERYLVGHPSLEHRPLFVTADPNAASAAVIKVDDPDEAQIQLLVRQGFIVRTRTDADLVEARNANTQRRDMALRSGAQIVSTDFPVPDPPVGHGYVVRLPGGDPARCNPVDGPKRCRATDVENPKRLRH
jgi:hypothetical protein